MPRPRGGYRNARGDQLPGCTTVISRFGDKGGLLQWAFQQGKSGADSLYEKSDEAADIGTFAHALFEAHRRGLTPPPPPAGMPKASIDKAETAFLNALKWEETVQIKSVAVELSLVCECHQYGCTIDEVALIQNRLNDFEWKTSTGIYVDHLLQAAAQKHAWECNHPDRPMEGATLVRWSKEYGDFSHHYFTDLEEPFKQFVRFREAWAADYLLRRRVR